MMKIRQSSELITVKLLTVRPHFLPQVKDLNLAVFHL